MDAEIELPALGKRIVKELVNTPAHPPTELLLIADVLYMKDGEECRHMFKFGIRNQMLEDVSLVTDGQQYLYILLDFINRDVDILGDDTVDSIQEYLLPCWP